MSKFVQDTMAHLQAIRLLAAFMWIPSLSVYGAPICHHITNGQTIHSIDYPAAYPNGPTENFVITAPAGTLIKLTIKKLDTRPPSDGGKCDSTSDNVSIYDAKEKVRSKLIVKLCGDQKPSKPIFTTGNFGFIRFTTKSDNDEYTGFKIKIEFTDPDPKIPNPWYDGDIACGTSKYSDGGETQPLQEARIINGIPARPGEYPWQVMMVYDGFLLCGGSIINENWIITAGHCVVGNLNPDLWEIFVGSITFFGGARLSASAVFLHEDYFVAEDNALHHDFALIKLKDSLVLRDDILPICPPLPRQVFEHIRAIASGWGINENDAISIVLSAVALNVSTNAACRDNWAGVATVTDDMLCTHDNGDNTDRDTCSGDSGGPLVVKGPDKVFRLAGVVSWGSFPCANGHFGVYGRTTEAMDWIQSVLDDN